MKQTIIDDQKENNVKRAIIDIFSLSEYKVKDKIKTLKELIRHYKSETVGIWKNR
jgi:hypothetical protein